MKKIAIFFFILIAIIAGVSYTYMKYRANYYEAKRENNQFESYYEQEFYGNEVATIINKAIDNNLTNQVQRNEKGKFIENDTNSIKIDLKMLDTDKTYDMETLYAGGMDKFSQYYNGIKFKCTRNRLS